MIVVLNGLGNKYTRCIQLPKLYLYLILSCFQQTNSWNLLKVPFVLWTSYVLAGPPTVSQQRLNALQVTYGSRWPVGDFEFREAEKMARSHVEGAGSVKMLFVVVFYSQLFWWVKFMVWLMEMVAYLTCLLTDWLVHSLLAWSRSPWKCRKDIEQPWQHRRWILS